MRPIIYGDFLGASRRLVDGPARVRDAHEAAILASAEAELDAIPLMDAVVAVWLVEEPAHHRALPADAERPHPDDFHPLDALLQQVGPDVVRVLWVTQRVDIG